MHIASKSISELKKQILENFNDKLEIINNPGLSIDIVPKTYTFEFCQFEKEPLIFLVEYAKLHNMELTIGVLNGKPYCYMYAVF